MLIPLLSFAIRPGERGLFSCADGSRHRLLGALFERMDLSYANLVGASLSESYFYEVDLSSASFASS